MPVYVVSDASGSYVYTEWAEASAAMRGRSGSACRKFRNQQEAVEFITELRFTSPPSSDDIIIYTDGSAKNKSFAVGAAFVYPGDPRNKTEQLTVPPFTCFRAELLGACLGAELLMGRTGVVIVDCELVARAYRENFPSWWPSQDLILRLRDACKRGPNTRIQWIKGHSGDPGNDGAHQLCYSAVSRLSQA